MSKCKKQSSHHWDLSPCMMICNQSRTTKKFSDFLLILTNLEQLHKIKKGSNKLIRIICNNALNIINLIFFICPIYRWKAKIRNNVWESMKCYCWYAIINLFISILSFIYFQLLIKNSCVVLQIYIVKDIRAYSNCLDLL